MTATIPTQRNRASMTVGQALGELHDHQFVIHDHTAEYIHDRFRVHVVLREDGHQILHVSYLRGSQQPLFLHFSGGIEAGGEFTPYTRGAVVDQAVEFADLIAAGKLKVRALA